MTEHLVSKIRPSFFADAHTAYIWDLIHRHFGSRGASVMRRLPDERVWVLMNEISLSSARRVKDEAQTTKTPN